MDDDKDQERAQLRAIRRMMNQDGWTYLMAAWIQLRESKILGKLKNTHAETHWRFQQGRLDGFDDAVNLAERLVGDLQDEVTAEQAQTEADELVKSIRT